MGILKINLMNTAKILTHQIVKRLAEVYPTGSLYEPDEDILKKSNTFDRLKPLIQFLGKKLNLHYQCSSREEQNYSLYFTQQNHMGFDNWIYLPNDEKLYYIKEYGDRFPVFLMKVSKVADYYYYWYNIWVPRGNTGYLDIDLQEPSQLWINHEKEINASFKSYGFDMFPKKGYSIKVPNVKFQDFDSIPEDDPRWDDEDFELPMVDAYLGDCIFGEQ